VVPGDRCLRPCVVVESGCLEVQLKAGGSSLLRLNTGRRPIANKYREGKMKSAPKGSVKQDLKSLRGKGSEIGRGAPPLCRLRGAMGGAFCHGQHRPDRPETARGLVKWL